LDKKLILRADKIQINLVNDDKNSKFELIAFKKALGLNDYLNLFSNIEIKNLIVNKHKFFLSYANKKLALKNNNFDFNLRYKIDKKKHIIYNTINILEKDDKIKVKANVNVDFKSKKIRVFSTILSDNFFVKLRAKINQNTNEYSLKTKKFKIHSLNFLSNIFKFDSSAKAWIEDRLKFKSLEISKINISSKGLDVKKILKNIQVNLKFNDFSLRYLDDAPKLKAKTLSASLRDGNIYFGLKDAFVDKINIDKSKIALLDAFSKKARVAFDIKTNFFPRPTFVLKMKEVNEGVKEWAIRRLKAKEYKIFSAKNTIKLSDGSFDYHTFDLFAMAKNANFVFKGEQNTLHTNILYTRFKKGDIRFFFDTPSVNGYKLDSSKAILHNAFDDSIALELDLHSKNAFDSRPLNILKAYGILVPFAQLDGKSKTNVNILFPIHGNEKIKVKADYDTTSSDFSYHGIKFLAKKLKFILKDNVISLAKSCVFYVKGFTLDHVKSNFYLNSMHMIFNSSLRDKYGIVKGRLINSYDVKNGILSGYFNIKHAKYPQLLNITNEQIPYSVYFAKQIKAYFPTLETFYTYDEKKGYSLEMQDLQKLYNFIPFFDEFEISNGFIRMQGTNLDDINLQARLSGFNLPVYLKRKQLKSVLVNARIKNQNDIVLNSAKKNLNLHINFARKLNISGSLKNIGFKVKLKNEKNIKKAETYKENINKSFDLGKFILPKIDVDFQNGFFAFNSNQINFDKLNFTSNKRNLYLVLNDKKTTLDISKKKRKMNISLKNANDDFVNRLFGKVVLKDGSANLYAKGDMGVLNGHIDLNSTKVQNIALINRLIIFLNLINPVSTLQTTTKVIEQKFDTGSYFLKKGLLKFKYTKKNELLNFYSIKTFGKMANFDARLKIFVKKKKLDGAVKIIFMKDYSAIVGQIPILNYILLGDDKNVYMLADIKGSPSNPDVQTHITKETSLIPFKLLGRIMIVPIRALSNLIQNTNDKNASKNLNATKNINKKSSKIKKDGVTGKKNSKNNSSKIENINHNVILEEEKNQLSKKVENTK